MAKIGFIKLGNLGISQVIELVQDEIAARENISIRVFGTGPKMGKDEAGDTSQFKDMEWDADFYVLISPNASAPGPTAAREIWKDVPCIVISDGPTKKEDRQALEDAGFGYIILKVDPLIGAKTEFLDSSEMASFNADVMKVLSTCGVVRLIQEELDNVAEQVDSGKSGSELELPHILGKPEVCVERAEFTNPYAKAKALASLFMAEKVAQINFPACFMMKEIEQVALTTATGHEMIRAAADLAIEAREIEKASDSVIRTPHSKKGKVLSKTKLYEKPQ
ncbi:F420-dependent methylenetetrahydromethanopterin dehydrogenase [Methanosalsum natronophilum]|uniref:F420-dependent methylenetetrahydromethanopterin dehydrogenase n=1 Tax=Methanosalsum natronophilum TaxID=768733 RepID=A0A424Z3U6_9EURY|nr:F420-dependent methylenetetrahydromethanopterin dehydrogenase [Methanosalsum natronophilum]MCS3923810.1 methylenetetrahydromethanopterin dehydrogenase [Methanosalsum natronophilum]RQD90720.1 MAG: F420-dependent methylenetetrahydromethanopterin dehydrogenase [Methanosalsum natronophilum]